MRKGLGLSWVMECNIISGGPVGAADVEAVFGRWGRKWRLASSSTATTWESAPPHSPLGRRMTGTH
ncbi:hypothetical protein EHS14_00285 [Schaalia georgiae]|nr:hypothetical protein EHS14_00285 [Schaalia georgiae]